MGMLLAELDQDRINQEFIDEGFEEGRAVGLSQGLSQGINSARADFLQRAATAVASGTTTLTAASNLFGFSEDEISAAINNSASLN